MELFIFRSGVTQAVPADYAANPHHTSLVAQLNATNRFAEAVSVLESHTDGYLAADVLTGAAWARRYLNTVARLWSQGPTERRQAERGMKALLAVLSGVKPRIGRHRVGPLTPAQIEAGASAIAKWRVVVDAAWPLDPSSFVAALARAARPTFDLSSAHLTALRRLVRHRGVRKATVVLSLASWETRIPIRRLRLTRTTADLMYG